MFSRTVPPNSVASCATSPIWPRRLSTVTSRMSIPSTRIVPAVTSHRRGISPTSVVLPDPDGPTRARVSPAGIVSESSRTTGRSGRYANDTSSSSIRPATGPSGRASGASRIVGRVSMISNTRSIAPVPSRNCPYRLASEPRLAPIATPYSRNPVSVPIPSVPSMTWWPVYQSSAAMAPKPRKPISIPNSARHRARRDPVATTVRRSLS